jgi:hypothetical protein
VTESEFLERFDRRLEKVDLQLELMRAQDERGRELMDRNNQLMDRNNELFLEVKEELRLNREEREDLRTFTRDLTRRNELVLRGVRDDLAELADQARAQTEAIMRVLDRLGPSPT